MFLKLLSHAISKTNVSTKLQLKNEGSHNIKSRVQGLCHFQID